MWITWQLAHFNQLLFVTDSKQMHRSSKALPKCSCNWSWSSSKDHKQRLCYTAHPTEKSVRIKYSLNMLVNHLSHNQNNWGKTFQWEISRNSSKVWQITKPFQPGNSDFVHNHTSAHKYHNIWTTPISILSQSQNDKFQIQDQQSSN
jgi:hypothetical protein